MPQWLFVAVGGGGVVVVGFFHCPFLSSSLIRVHSSMPPTG